jgi:hypothetical protein
VEAKPVILDQLEKVRSLIDRIKSVGEVVSGISALFSGYAIAAERLL